MQFRERRRVIQVIRTVYDPELKRGRSEVVGKIDKATPAVTDKLQKTCTPEELSEILTYLDDRRNRLRNEAVRAGAETLPAQMREAAEYFRTHRDGEAREFATEIRLAWEELKAALRESGFSKNKVLKKAGERDKTGEKAEASAPAVMEPVAETAAEPEAASVEATPAGKPRAKRTRAGKAVADSGETASPTS